MKEYTVKVYEDRAEWRLDGLLHREDGPAVENSDGTLEWYQHGKLHREDGPAVEYFNGTKEWWRNGQLHREDGPATRHWGGSKQWYLNGQKLTEEEHLRLTTSEKELTVKEIEQLLGYKIKVVA